MHTILSMQSQKPLMEFEDGATLVASVLPYKKYWDKDTCQSPQDWESAVEVSCAVYVGNLSVYTAETQVYDSFRTCGPLTEIVMGLSKKTNKPAGFCFVVFEAPVFCKAAVAKLNQTCVDGRTIRVDLDSGRFLEQRKFGRGQIMGLQVRDDVRRGEDSGRLGYGGGQVFAPSMSTREDYNNNRGERGGYGGRQNRDREVKHDIAC